MVAIAALSSCSSDDTVVDQHGNSNPASEAKVFTGYIEGDSATRTTIADGTTGKKVNWDASDEICINGIRYKAKPDGTDATRATFFKKTASDADPSGTYKACYPASMASGTGNNVTLSLPATYTYEAGRFNMPMYAESTTTELGFQNICGVLAIRVTSEEMSEVTKIAVTSDQYIWGPCTISDTDGKFAAKAKRNAEDDNYTVTLDCGTGVAPAAEADGGTTFYLPIPPITKARLQIAVYGTINATKAASYEPLIYSQAMVANGVSIARNTIYNINFRTSLAKFTVAETGLSEPAKKVYFTKGNLQATYNSTTKIYTWGFAAHQQDCIGNRAGNNSIDKQTDGAVVDLFGWSAADNYGISTSTGSAANDGDFKDWGALFHDKGYVTLTSAEWDYLIKERTNAAYLYQHGITVKDGSNEYPYCFIIAPDGFADLHQSPYTLQEINTLGLVCLPAAGYRSGTTVADFQSYGYYWSATVNTQNLGYAYCLKTWSSSTPTIETYRNFGCSVRLVKVAE